MSIALALLVSADPVTIGKFSLPWRSIRSLLRSARGYWPRFACCIAESSMPLSSISNWRIDCGRILDEVRVAPIQSNRRDLCDCRQ
jgi:hypothetical protein